MVMKVHYLTHLMKYRLFPRLPPEVSDVLRNLIRSILVDSVISRIRELERRCRTLDDYFNLTQYFEGPIVSIDISSGQKKKEILNLLDRASGVGLRTVVEIGTCRGGTFYLLCKVADNNAVILTMDIKMPWWRKRLLRSFVRPRQTPITLRKDSHRHSTINFVKESLQNKIDLLFIDGDHSYDGVRKDFINYSPLVRKGGWIAFHDIIPARLTDNGIRRGAWTGGVPKYWNELKRSHEHFEIVDNPNQDGAGIGVLLRE
jgi:predicted O-methyltransferase YrrM